MSSYRWGVTDRLSLDEIDLGFRRYRLQRPEAEQAMLGSLRRYGQLSPVVVCDVDGRMVLVDGFKRHAAAIQVKGMDTLWTRHLEADASTAKAAMYTLNALSGPVQALEESWIVHALVREDGLSQPAVATLTARGRSHGRKTANDSPSRTAATAFGSRPASRPLISPNVTRSCEPTR